MLFLDRVTRTQSYLQCNFVTSHFKNQHFLQLFETLNTTVTTLSTKMFGAKSSVDGKILVIFFYFAFNFRLNVYDFDDKRNSGAFL